MVMILADFLWVFCNYYLMTKIVNEKIPYHSFLFWLYLWCYTLLCYLYPSYSLIIEIGASMLWFRFMYHLPFSKTLIALGFTYISVTVIELNLSCIIVFLDKQQYIGMNIPYLQILLSILLFLFANCSYFIKIYHKILKSSVRKINPLFLIGFFFFLILILYVKTIHWNFTDTLWFLPILILFSFLFMMEIIREKSMYEELQTQYQELSYSRKKLDQIFQKQEAEKHIYRNQLLILQSLAKDKTEVKKYLDQLLKIDYDSSYRFLGKENTIELSKIHHLMWRQNLYYKLIEFRKQNVDILVDIQLEEHFQKKIQTDEILGCDILLLSNLMIDLAKKVVENQEKTEFNFVIQNDQKKVYINCIARVENNLKLLKRLEESSLIEEMIHKSDCMQYSSEVLDDVYLQVLEIF